MKAARYPVVAFAAFSLLAAGPAQAAKHMTLKQLQEQVEALSAQVQSLGEIVQQQGAIIAAQKQQIDAQQQQTGQVAQQLDKTQALAAAAAAKADNAPDVHITMSPMPRIESADGNYSFQPFGRVHLDTTVFHDDKSDRPDNANLRRARLGFKGDLGEDFNYKAEVDFGEEKVNIKEMFLAYTGFDAANVWLGNFKPPVGFEQNTSANYWQFTELSPASKVFTRDEILGAAVKGGGREWGWQAGVFNEDAGNNNPADDEGWSLDAHASVDLLQDNPNVLHLGLGGSARKPDPGMPVTLSTKPAGTGADMVSTGPIAGVRRSYVYGPEVAAVFGPFTAQGEYFRDDLRIDGAPDASFDGWYAQAGYFLTGESRPYKGRLGNFERVKPRHPFSITHGGWGAWEILARYDALDLNDAGAGILGGRLTDWTFGVNWQPVDNIRFMLDYALVNTDQNAAVPDDDPQFAILRAQWDF